MKDLLKKIKKSPNIALALFALLGFLANELLSLGVENTVLRTLVDKLLQSL